MTGFAFVLWLPRVRQPEVRLFDKKAAADAQAAAAAESPDTPNVLQAMIQLEQVKTRGNSTNKVALESEKEKDTAEKE